MNGPTSITACVILIYKGVRVQLANGQIACYFSLVIIEASILGTVTF
jgi:hypothetical protein